MKAVLTIGSLLLFLARSGAAQDEDYGKMLEKAAYSLSEAIGKAMQAAKEGVPFEAEIEEDKGRVVYSIDVAQGQQVFAIAFDAKDGSVFEKEIESEDHSKVAQAAKIPLVQAIETGLKKVPGKAVIARYAMKGEKPEARIHVFADGKVTVVVVDAISGEVLKAEAAPRVAQEARGPEGPPAFTDTFGEDERDFVTTGTNPYFVLEPGWFIELAGRKGDQEVVISITVLDVTKKIAGVECRAVEEKETVGGQVKESTRDYFVISKRTNNVYYFGEDVDVYQDGKLVGHEGAWLAGEKGARYGLFMPGVPLLGSRYYQEIAPGVAMDRGEITSLTEKLETPAGKFDGVLKIVETSDLEKGAGETNLYVRGIGVVMDDDLKLTKYGKKQ